MKYALAAALFAASLSLATAQTPAASGGVAVTGPWSRATAGPAVKTGAAYFTLATGGAADALTGASTPVADKAEVHQTTEVNGVMQMRAVASVPLEPGKPVTFTPGSYHVMLMGLHQPLKQGETFPLTLTFSHAQPVTVEVKVAPAGAASGHGMPGMHHMDDTAMPGIHKP